MHWVIQTDINREQGFIDLLDTLERFNIPHSVIKLIPFSSNLPPEERMTPVVNPSNPVMVTGSLGMSSLARSMNWSPGTFDNENHDYRVWAPKYAEHCLNAESIISKFGEVEHRWDEFFIRPCGDNKEFNGQVITWDSMHLWQHKVINLKETYTTLNYNTMVVCSPVKTIYREARFFVVEGRVVTGSTYRLSNKTFISAEVPPSMTDFAQKMVDLYQPSEAFVIDIALVENNYNIEEYKVIEINCINGSGFYAIDIQKFVMAIENMKV